MERGSGSESGGERAQNRRGERDFDYEVIIQEMQRRMEIMELELGEHRERLRRDGLPLPPIEGGGPRPPPREEEPRLHEEDDLGPRMRGEVRREPRLEPQSEEEEGNWEHPPQAPRVRVRSRSPRREGGGRDQERPNGGRGLGNVNALDVKVDIPEFDGKGGAESFLEWVHMVDRVLELKEVDGREVVRLIALRLRGYASIWWDYVEKQRVEKGKARVRSWGKMKRLLRERFVPFNYRQSLYLKLQGLKQGSMSIEEYLMAFEDLKLKCELKEEEEHSIARFLGP